MADKSIIIPSFKYGLDTRRENLVSLPGTLQLAQNCFINSGGELEKRKAFVLVGTIPVGANGLRGAGFQDTDTGIMVFSSSASPGGLPTNVVWQRIVFPNTADTVDLLATLYSTAFTGKSFVLTFPTLTNPPFAFYNGTIVSQYSDGIVHSTLGNPVVVETISELSSDLAAIVNRIPTWLAHANKAANTPYNPPTDAPEVGYRETTLAGSTLLMSPVGVHFSPVIINNNSVLGKLGVRLIDQNYPGVVAKSAAAFFTINAGTAGTLNVLAPYNEDGTSKLTLTNGALTLAGPTTLPTFAIQVADAVNNYSFLTGYTADVEGTTVTIFAPASFGDAFNGPPGGTSTVRLTVDCTGDVTTNGTGSVGTPFLVKLVSSSGGPNLDAVKFVSNFTDLTDVQGNIVASATGSNGTVTFTWTEISALNGTILWGTSGTFGRPALSIGPTCGFKASLRAGTDAQGYYNLKAQDSTTIINLTVFVKLSCNIN